MAQRPLVVSVAELAERCTAPVEYIVAPCVAAASVNLFVGDSGLGKSPFAYQMALAVATGRPFAGLETKRGPVVYVDLENGESSVWEILASLMEFEGIKSPPSNLFIFSSAAAQLESALAQVKPVLVVVDSLRAMWPDAETENEGTAELLSKLHKWGAKYGCAFLLIHHIRKPHEDGTPSLKETPVSKWMNEAAGARSLINQTDSRLGIEATTVNKEDALLVKGFERVRGEFGPWYFERVLDDDGIPLGYRRMTGPQLLFNPEQAAAIGRLPVTFTTKQARLVYGKSAHPTAKFLHRAAAVGIIKSVGRGQWEKTATLEASQLARPLEQ